MKSARHFPSQTISPHYHSWKSLKVHRPHLSPVHRPHLSSVHHHRLSLSISRSRYVDSLHCVILIVYSMILILIMYCVNLILGHFHAISESKITDRFNEYLFEILDMYRAVSVTYSSNIRIRYSISATLELSMLLRVPLEFLP